MAPGDPLVRGAGDIDLALPGEPLPNDDRTGEGDPLALVGSGEATAGGEQASEAASLGGSGGWERAREGALF